MNRLDGKNFLRGFGRVLDVRGATAPLYVRKARWIHSDSRAVADDWAAVFGDLDAAYHRVRRSKGEA
jgi:hypothetical protein